MTVCLIHLDCASTTFKPSDIFERGTNRAGNVRPLMKLYAVAGIEPGVVGVYPSSETISKDNAVGSRLIFQRIFQMQEGSDKVRRCGESTFSSWKYDVEYSEFAELNSGSVSDEERVGRVYEFIQNRMNDLEYDSSPTDDTKEYLDIKDADEASNREMGSPFNLVMLSASLGTVAGFETKVILSSDRREDLFASEMCPFQNFKASNDVRLEIASPSDFEVDRFEETRPCSVPQGSAS